MPFPLAHPAAVWPLRRWCPRHLSLAALIIGSLVPDVGYLFDRRFIAPRSHSFWGALGFCLPMGLLLFWGFRCARRLLLWIPPSKLTQPIRSLSEESSPPFFALLVSLLFGAWTHILLDSITHAEGWIVQHFTALQHAVFSLGGREVRVFHLLYYGITFLGMTYLAFSFQQSFERGQNTETKSASRKWAFALLISGLLLLVCAFSRRAL